MPQWAQTGELRHLHLGAAGERGKRALSSGSILLRPNQFSTTAQALTGGLFHATKEDFYGTASTDGAYGGGTVFKIPGEARSRSYRFCSQINCTDVDLLCVWWSADDSLLPLYSTKAACTRRRLGHFFEDELSLPCGKERQIQEKALLLLGHRPLVKGSFEGGDFGWRTRTDQ